MPLETLEPDPSFDPGSLDPAVLDALDDDYRYVVWGGDWCGDCQAQLPAFGAALSAAGIDDDQIRSYPVSKGPNGKEGPGVDAYGIERIPTVVVEDADGEELTRFVEEADVSIAEALARELGGVDGTQ